MLYKIKPMNLKKLARAAKLYEQIKALDGEIIEVEKMAMLVANGETKSTFELHIEDLNKNEDEAKSVLDDCNTPSGWMQEMMMGFRTGGTLKKTEPSGNKLKSILSETLTLQILGELLFDKNYQRELLVSKIQSLNLTT